VAQKELVVSLGNMDQEAATSIYAYKAFPNTKKGFSSMAQWVVRQTNSISPLKYVMEATGVYHEALAYFLSESGYSVSIVMPNKVTNFFKTLEVKTITDKSMSEAIALFGLSKQLDDWAPPQVAFRELRQLTREREQLIAERTMLKNQLHAEQTEAYPGKNIISRMKERIKMIDGQLKKRFSEITAAIKSDEK